MLKLNETLGSYEPSFFKMWINTDGPVYFGSLTVAEQSTFVHEYVHFLQDFMTLYGLNNAYCTVEYMREYVNKIYGARKVVLPMKGEMVALKAMRILTSIIFGYHGTIKRIRHVRNVRVVSVNPTAEMLRLNPAVATLRKVTMEVRPDRCRWMDIEFGALAILEGMAALAQEIMIPAVKRKQPDYPYHIVRMVAQRYDLALSRNAEMLFALCDIALQTSVPGPAFVEMAQQSVQHGIKTADDLYLHFIRQFAPWSDHSPTSVVDNARQHLCSHVKGPVGERYQAWVNNLIGTATALRQSDPMILLKMVRNGAGSGSIFDRLGAAIGSPLLSNNYGIWGKLPVALPGRFPFDFDVEFFPAIKYIYELLARGLVECPMREWCFRSPDVRNQVDNACRVSPPAHSDNRIYSQGFCPVGALWRHWNLGRYRLRGQVLYRPLCR